MLKVGDWVEVPSGVWLHKRDPNDIREFRKPPERAVGEIVLVKTLGLEGLRARVRVRLLDGSEWECWSVWLRKIEPTEALSSVGDKRDKKDKRAYLKVG